MIIIISEVITVLHSIIRFGLLYRRVSPIEHVYRASLKTMIDITNLYVNL